ncbi:hypothetical protein M758_6G157200 [Ceratodon purpureus]|nr:hypothetical protein M758_6G157200 [Ceratodon purpureus]
MPFLSVSLPFRSENVHTLNVYMLMNRISCCAVFSSLCVFLECVFVSPHLLGTALLLCDSVPHGLAPDWLTAPPGPTCHAMGFISFFLLWFRGVSGLNPGDQNTGWYSTGV